MARKMIVVFGDLVLVSCLAYLSSLSLFSSSSSRLSLNSISLFFMSKFEILKLGISIFIGITDYVPYTIENGVSLVGILLIVWCAQSMLGKSSTHSLLNFSGLVFKFLKIALLVTLTGPFA